MTTTEEADLLAFKYPVYIYAGIINLIGVYNKEPIKCFLRSDLRGKPEWFNKDEDLVIKKIGIDYRCEHTIFSSPNADQVKTWIAGAQAVMRQLKSFIGDSIGCKVCNTDTDSESEMCLFCRSNETEHSPHCRSCGYVTLWHKGFYECQNCKQFE